MNKKAFTLIKLLVVIVIIGIIGTVNLRNIGIAILLYVDDNKHCLPPGSGPTVLYNALDDYLDDEEDIFICPDYKKYVRTEPETFIRDNSVSCDPDLPASFDGL